MNKVEIEEREEKEGAIGVGSLWKAPSGAVYILFSFEGA